MRDLEVTGAHIAAGVQGKGSMCPLAQALSDDRVATSADLYTPAHGVVSGVGEAISLNDDE